MANTISLTMIEQSTDEHCLWLDQPDRLAHELYPDSPLNNDPHDYTSPLSDSDLVAIFIYGDLERFSLGGKSLPEWLQPDQLEDFIAARAVKQLLLTRDTAERLRG